MIGTFRVTFSDEQKAVVLNHILYQGPLGILETEYPLIRAISKEILEKQGYSLLSIQKAEMDIDSAEWDVTCKIERLDHEKTKENEDEHI